MRDEKEKSTDKTRLNHVYLSYICYLTKKSTVHPMIETIKFNRVIPDVFVDSLSQDEPTDIWNK